MNITTDDAQPTPAQLVAEAQAQAAARATLEQIKADEAVLRESRQ